MGSASLTLRTILLPHLTQLVRELGARAVLAGIIMVLALNPILFTRKRVAKYRITVLSS